MMVLSDRQRHILDKTVFEYIDRAQPVSSSWLGARYELQFSPATIRSELGVLTEEGYLEQPHTSSGRVPTDLGYRFFVDERLKEVQHKRVQQISRFSDLVLAYHRNILWKEGWEQLLQEPEFEKGGVVQKFTRFLVDVERNAKQLLSQRQLEVFIGKENPISRVRDFSLIVYRCDFDEGQNGFVAIVGPKRMPYHRNIGLIQSFVDIWKKRLKK